MHPGHVESDLKELRVQCERFGRHVSAPGKSVYADAAAGIDVLPGHQVVRRTNEVEDLGVGGKSPARRVTECLAAHDATTVLHGEDDAPAAREVLVHVVE